MFKSIFLSLSLCAVASTALATDISWRDIMPKLEGCWNGEGMGGTISECWIIAADGRADGMFLLRTGDKPTFAEILTIDAFDDGVEMRLKHVNPDMTGWEDKDDYTRFQLVSVEQDRLIFKGLTLIFKGDSQLTAELQMTSGEDKVRTVTFDFVRTAHLDREVATD
ncbi:MAG: DUF6265 family protein [Litorimonas sp.]